MQHNSEFHVGLHSLLKSHLGVTSIQGVKDLESGRTLAHINLASFCGTSANCAEPAQTPQNGVSDQGFCRLLTECSIKIG